MKCLTCKKRLSALCLESLELRRLKADLIVCFKILRGFTNVIPSEFYVWSSSSTRGHNMKLGFQSYCSSKFFSLFVLSNYGINCQKKWHQPAVSVLLYRVKIQRMCRFLTFCSSAVCFFINVYFTAVVSALRPFLSSRHSSALYCFYCIVSVLTNKILIHTVVTPLRVTNERVV